MTEKFIRSPLNYIGGKYKILPQILPLFPSQIGCFVDLFAGGANVGINIAADKIILNDCLSPLMDFYRVLKQLSEREILAHIYGRIEQYALSLTNETGYKALRDIYNKEKNPLDLFVLSSYSFNHQIRFNNAGGFNNPFGRSRSRYNQNIEANLKAFLRKLQDAQIEFFSGDFSEFDISGLSKGDMVYCDPPYLITTGTYNDGRRGFTGWGEEQEIKLLDFLDRLDGKNIPFALSNVLQHKGRRNRLLSGWIERHPAYQVIRIKKDYANSNYQSKTETGHITEEVLIANYCPSKPDGKSLPLFQQKRNNEIYREQRECYSENLCRP